MAEVEQAAEKGDAESQYELALRYQSGKGVKQDFVSAANWYYKAA
ncbi:MAG: SEL1-like repeat protein, partial [Gammaproteobacteria bacterium]|nr:SEL1-like repeat protein [Gammaproteobacteria bacterium]